MDKLRELMGKMYAEDLVESRIQAIAGIGGDEDEQAAEGDDYEKEEKAVVD